MDERKTHNERVAFLILSARNANNEYEWPIIGKRIDN